MRILMLGLLLLMNCSQKQSAINSVDAQKNIKALISESLGELYNEYYNTDSTYMLAVQKPGSSPMLKYMVIEMATSTLAKQGSFNPGYVKWKDNTNLEVLSAPGNLPKDKNLSDYIRIINLNPNPQQ